MVEIAFIFSYAVQEQPEHNSKVSDHHQIVKYQSITSLFQFHERTLVSEVFLDFSPHEMVLSSHLISSQNQEKPLGPGYERPVSIKVTCNYTKIRFNLFALYFSTLFWQGKQPAETLYFNTLVRFAWRRQLSEKPYGNYFNNSRISYKRINFSKHTLKGKACNMKTTRTSLISSMGGLQAFS